MVAREALRHHTRHILCNQWFRVKNIIDRQGGSYIDYIPSYINEVVWKSLCDYWASPTFQRRSGVARIARQHVTPHTSGGISFSRRSWGKMIVPDDQPSSSDSDDDQPQSFPSSNVV
ncbi:hypothetical protein POM88_027678 [Heracleum sosnowskyi]|uniref:Uncharacterized protein n=1 Tax=Heracleum sosnowskyi TaxID=360622 RepID=A0AAD8I889_9APIA|nr:hypothetical protein POM88_027678 [Heracleum sosnowskyi]